LAVYFIYYYEKEDDVTKYTNKVTDNIQSGFDKIKDALSK